MSADQLAMALDPLPTDAPVVIRYGPPIGRREADIVDDALNQLEIVARQLLPAWLPEADGLDHSDLDRRAVRVMARQRSSESEHFGPFLADLAEAAVVGSQVGIGHPRDVRAHGLRRVLCEAYGRESVALLIGPTGDCDDERCATAFRWLADQGGIGVWLLGDALSSIDRFSTVRLALPEYIRVLGSDARPESDCPPAGYPPPEGRPHPASASERTLEDSLARCQWAYGRAWNRTHQSDPLARQIRVDLMWADARCVVELDGPDHRGQLKYAEDRRRDNALVQEGFAILRFTNEDIAEDLSRVLGIIEQVLSTRRGVERSNT